VLLLALLQRQVPMSGAVLPPVGWCSRVVCLEEV
jgi:hypothetical protein